VRWECDPVRIIVGAAKWQRTVGTAGVVMLRVFLEHGAQVSLTDHEHPVGALSPYRPDPAFGVRVPFSGTAVPIFFWMTSDPNRASNGSVNLLSRSRIAKRNAPARSPRSPDEAPGPPGHPTPRSGYRVTPRTRTRRICPLEHEENVDATETHQIDVKKSQASTVLACADTRRSGRDWHGRGQSVASQGLADRRGRDAVPPASQLAVDPRVSPCVVVVGQKHDQLHEIFAYRRPPWCLRPPPPAGGQALVPAQYRARDDEAVCA
jgi:hypothetical protein